LKILLEQIVNVHAADAQQFPHVGAAEAADLQTEPQQRETVGPCVGTEPRRHAREQRRESCRIAAHARGIERIGRRICRADPAREHQGDRERLASGDQRRGGQVSAGPGEAVRFELQCADHLAGH
jgi:hypothetical protein